VNPDEVVAIGAAIQAGVLGGDVKDILLLDVTPLTLSVETLGGVATPLIERNTTIPARKSQVFSTAAHNQNQVEINVLQGERPMANDNKSLGRFILDGIPPAPRGVPQIEVTFDIDANGILKVTAQDKATGRSQHITITASSGLSEAEVDRMKQEAEAHAAEDEKRKAQVEARNNADNMAYQAEKALEDLGDKVPPDVQEQVRAEVENVKKVLEDTEASAETIEQATEQLTQVVQKIGEAAYQQQGPMPGAGGMPEAEDFTPPPGGEDQPGPNDDEDVIDGDFKDA
jgi:molecular chaperone DnaK